MTKREVVKTVLEHKKAPYVPWSFGFTLEAGEKLKEHYGTDDLQSVLDNHLLVLGNPNGTFKDIGNDRYQDYFGVIWDRSVDKDIGVVENCLLPEPDISEYGFPDPQADLFFENIESDIDKYPECYRVFPIGFSLYERAWTLRGMENLMMDFYDNSQFIKDLMHTIADFNIAHLTKAVAYDIDAIYFGDDWGQQSGLQMGYDLWKEFLFPELKRTYGAVKNAGKKVFIHSCGDVDELFGDLVDIGLDCFNPFQPEVMDVDALMKEYKGKLSFHGGLSTQKTLPYGSTEDVVNEVEHLLELGADGGYIMAPAHAVEGDVPLENMLAFIDTAKKQLK